MIPLEFSVVTAATVVSIGAILVTYVSVLKKNGWIGNAPASLQNEPKPAPNPAPTPAENAAPTISEEKEAPEEVKEAAPAAEEENDEFGPAEKKIFLKQKLAQKLLEAQKSSQERVATPRCPQHFGYLYSLVKNEEIPEACYCCPNLIQCFKEPEN